MFKFLQTVAVFVLTLLAASLCLSATNDRQTKAIISTEAVLGEQRVALVIGNGEYANSPLINSINDARAIAKLLREVGFRVTLLENATLRQMAEAVRAFGDTLEGGGTGLFYYAGHGMQIKGRNYLIPVGTSIRREDEVAFNAFDAGQLLEKLETARNRVNIVILDACRNNPFARSFRSAGQGLAQMEAPAGTYISFATAPGRVASDGADDANGNGLYTQHLLSAIRKPGFKIEEVFKQVRVGVINDSGGEQVPWDNSSLTGDFYFLPPQSQGISAPIPEAVSIGRATAEPIVKGSEPDQRQDRRSGMATGGSPVNAQAQEQKLALALPSAPQRTEKRSIQLNERSESASTLYRSGMDAKGRGDILAAMDAFNRASESNHPEASYELGMLLKIGRRPTVQDLPRAHQLFLRSAGQGNSTAQYETAQSFARGQGVGKSCGDALKWAKRSAEGGLAEAAALYGELSLVNCEGSTNPREAAKWLRVAADKGLPSAQLSLGVLYMNGDGVPKSSQDARKWLSSAADKGNTSAKFYLDRLPN